jgi:ATP/maltotriose-dependent transcriptional regulator MalT
MQVERSAAEDLQPVRRLIERPRLTSILDGAKARLLLLHAPAGYGKTTLARQWLAHRRHVWYAAGPAASDVAALAASIADLCSEVIAGSGERMRDRLRVTPSPADDADVLGEMLAEDVADWPHDVWLAIDDYQYAAVSDASEAFMETLVRNAPLRLLATSREKPRWATARRQMYGELLELGTSHLAMTEEEAHGVLGHGHRNAMVELAGGWPAVIGLAALAGDEFKTTAGMPQTLYDYVAQELYSASNADTQWQLCQLATLALLTPLDGSPGLAEARRLGFVVETGAPPYSTLHPLLRTFLEAKLLEQDLDRVEALLLSVVRAALDEKRWDDAFSVIDRFEQPALFETLLETAISELLRGGRHATLEMWADYARKRSVGLPILDLVDAERAFREGDYSRAEAFAGHAAERLENQTLRAHAYRRAGTAAIFGSRETAALVYQERALDTATTIAERREALILRLNAAKEAEEPELSREALCQLERLPRESLDDHLRVSVGRLSLALTYGGLCEAVTNAETSLPLVDRAHDPLTHASFLHVLSGAFCLLARYSDALETSDRHLALSRRFRLDWIIGHALSTSAFAHVGLKNFDQAQEVVDASLSGRTGRDPYLVTKGRIALARLDLARGQPDAAIARLVLDSLVSRQGVYRGEYLATLSVAHACAGQHADADKRATQARELTTDVLVELLVSVSRLVSSTMSDGWTVEAQNLWSRASETGFVDCVVLAYRSYPDFLSRVAETVELRDRLAGVMLESNDRELAELHRIVPSRPRDHRESLTVRERDVYDLVTAGLTNREIAQRLYISEATAKVHVRHILRKLNVRSRTEAAVLGVRQPAP